jgi:hypothetical protein
MIVILDGFHLVGIYFRFLIKKNSFHLGHSSSGPAQVAQWNSMINAHGETITRWHALIDK